MIGIIIDVNDDIVDSPLEIIHVIINQYLNGDSISVIGLTIIQAL